MANSPIVARINALLAEKGISKQQFYKDCGITSASYSLWNTGKTQPRMKNLEVIADYLGVSVSYLVKGAEQKENPVAISNEVSNDLSPIKKEAINLVSKMSDEQLAVFVAALKAARGE